MEIERKFVVKEVPKGLKLLHVAEIRQVYVVANNEIEVRLRKYKIVGSYNSTKCKLTIKISTSNSLSRNELEFEVECDQVSKALSSRLPQIRKTRGYYDPAFLPGATEIVLDELETGDLIMEIEFESEDDAKDLEKTGFWKRYLSKQIEVTSDPRFKMKNLAKMSYREIKRLFKEVKG